MLKVDMNKTTCLATNAIVPTAVRGSFDAVPRVEPCLLRKTVVHLILARSGAGRLRNYTVNAVVIDLIARP